MNRMNENSIDGRVIGEAYNCAIVAIANLGLPIKGLILDGQEGMKRDTAIHEFKKRAVAWEEIKFHGSLESFTKNYSKGRYFVLLEHHGVAIINGKVLNLGECSIQDSIWESFALLDSKRKTKCAIYPWKMFRKFFDTLGKQISATIF